MSMEIEQTTTLFNSQGEAIIQEKEVIEIETTAVHTVKETPVITQIAHEAALRETISSFELKEIQPVIVRDIDTVEVHQITQPIYEEETMPTITKELVDATVIREDVILGNQEVVPLSENSSLVVEETQRETVVKTPIIHEIVHKKVIEEIQPIIYRHVTRNTVVHEKLPISEHIVQAPVVIKEMRAPILLESGKTFFADRIDVNVVEKVEVKTSTYDSMRTGPVSESTYTPLPIDEELTESYSWMGSDKHSENQLANYGKALALFSIPAILAYLF